VFTQKLFYLITNFLVVPEIAIITLPRFQHLRLGIFARDNPNCYLGCLLSSRTIESDRRHRIAAEAFLGPLCQRALGPVLNLHHILYSKLRSI